MKKKLILIVVFISTLIPLFGQDSYRQNLANLASITFPSKPDIVDTMGQRIYRYSDENAIYLVIINDVSKQKDFKLNEGDLDKYYNSTVDGVIKASHGELVSKNMFNLNHVRGIEMEYTSVSNPNLPDLIFQKLIFLNKTFITVNFWTHSQNKKLTQNKRDAFFNSFVATIDKRKIKQFTFSIDDQISDSGYKMGQIIFYLFTIGIIVGVIRFVKNRIKRVRHFKL